MKRSGILLATLLATVFGSALVASGLASAAEVSCWYNGGWHTCVYYPGYSYASPEVTPPLMTGRSVAEYPGYAYENGYPFDFGLGALATAPLAPAETAPLMTGRSVAVSGTASSPAPGGVAGPGNYCATSMKTCLLREPGWLGTGCSCRVSGGHARGFVE
jgi:hypothetical protein